jgi:hypothetical protein
MSDSTNTPALFSTFVMGLASAAMIELGLIEDPHSKEKKKNPAAARQHIDLLVMLQEKTRGNLSSDESQLLTSVITDLRLHFVKHTTANK